MTAINQSASGLAITEGSSLYYSLLYCTDAQRSRVQHTLTLIQTMTSALHEVTEPSVAEKKIHWWHEEIERLVKRDARHPDCVAAQRWLPHRSTAQACIDVLSVAASERFNPAVNDSEWLERIQQDYHARIVLVHHALQYDAEDRSNVPIKYTSMAQGLGQVDRLLLLPTLLKKGYAIFSDERFTQCNITPEDLLSLTSGTEPHSQDKQEAANNLIHWAMSQANTSLAQAMTESPFTDKPASKSLLPMIIMTTLRQQQVKLWLKKSPNLLRETVSVTPMRKFISTYRLKRRHA
jgi:hypothetical protein